MSRRRSVRVVPDCAIYQRFVRWSVRLVMPCVAVCRPSSWMECWMDRPPSERPVEKCQLSEVGVFRDDDIIALPRVLPDRSITCYVQTDLRDVAATRVLVAQASDESS